MRAVLTLMASTPQRNADCLPTLQIALLEAPGDEEESEGRAMITPEESRQIESLCVDLAEAERKHLIQNTPTERALAASIAGELALRIEAEWPDISRRLKITEAAHWLREGAPGRALTLLEEVLISYEANN